MPRMQTKNDNYDSFIKKFEPKKTTDDCYTPDNVFQCVEQWVRENADIGELETIRPFYPGGDYLAEDYRGKVVIDNPPFSIISQIVRHYEKNKIPYFLFAPGLTLFSVAHGEASCYIPIKATIIYTNGAIIRTGFITNLFPGKIYYPAELNRRIHDCKPDKSKPKTIADPDTITSGQIFKYCGDKDFRIPAAEYVTKNSSGKQYFGGGFKCPIKDLMTIFPDG